MNMKSILKSKVMSKVILFSISLMIFPVLTSCEKIGETPKERETSLLFNLTTPKIATPTPITKSQTEQEMQISEISVLVFEENDHGQLILTQKAIGNSITFDQDKQITSFRANLSSTPDPVTLLMVANANSSLSGITLGDTMEEVAQEVTIAYPATGITSYLPMSGMQELSSINADGNQTVSVEMLRSIARADVLVEAGNFELVDARIYRANSLIQMIPADVTGSIDWSDPAVLSPSVPSTSQLTANSNSSPVTADLNSIIAKLYVPEAEGILSGTGSTSIVIGGKYNGSNEVSYYRIDFNGGIQGHPYGQILRNYKYTFNIKSVAGQGWSTPDLAAENAPSFVEVTVQKWNEYTTYMESCGKEYLGVSGREVVLNSHQGDTHGIIVESSYSYNEINIQWYDNVSGSLTGAPSKSLENEWFNISFLNYNGTMLIVIQTKQWNVSSNNSVFNQFYIVTDRFEVPITIRQNSIAYDQVVKVWSRGSIGATASGSTAGIDNILTNRNNFGSLNNSKVRLDEIEFNNNSGSFAFDATADIVDLAYNASFGTVSNRPQNAQIIVNWLKEKDYRYLKISPENNDNIETYLLPILWYDADWASWPDMNLAKYISTYVLNDVSSARTRTLTFEAVDDNNSFILGPNAPFGAVLTDNQMNNYYNPHDGIYGLILQNPDGTFGPPGYNFIPLVTNTYESKKYMYVGIDTKNRILYVGDGSALQDKRKVDTDFQILNTTNDASGVIKPDMGYEANRLYANIWAYMIGDVVVPGKTREDLAN